MWAEDAAPAGPIDPAEAHREAEEAHRAFITRVNKAIDRGQEFLLKTQDKSGLWPAVSASSINVDFPGYQYLTLLALVKTGLRPNHPQMKPSLEAMTRLAAGQRMFRTYPAGCLAMLLDALYAEHLPDGKVKARLPADAKKMLVSLVDSLEKNQRGIWRYPTAGDEDLSASQYALLGLFSADRLGVKVKPETYRRAMRTILDWQERSGPEAPCWVENAAWQPGSRYPRFVKSGVATARGFRYQKSAGPISGSMTTAGVAALSIIKDRLADPALKQAALTREEEKLLDRGVLDGIAWVAENFAVHKNPGSPNQWHFYYLYGLERMCGLLGMKLVGKHDWYTEVAEYLVSQQAPDGSWPKSGDHGDGVIENTAFALLCLKRATAPTKFKVPAVTGGPDDATPDDKEK